MGNIVNTIKSNKDKIKYNKIKSERRATKRTDKRSITGEEVIFIFAPLTC